MDAVEELPANLPLVKPRLPHAFTRENAAEFTKKGLIARAVNRKARLEQASISGDPYVKRRLLCLRARIDELDDELSKADNPQSINYLASAISKLQEEERKLAGRALPGSRRPGRETPGKRSGEVGPVE